MKALQFIKSDPRHFQILFLGTFLINGVLVLHWNTHFTCISIVTTACLFTQLLWVKYKKLHINALKSALISALGLCLLMKTNTYWVMALAAVLTISSKFLIRYKGKHIFNPVNFGIIVTILLTDQAWISPGRWGSAGWFIFLVGSLGVLVLSQVKRLETSFAFFGTLFTLEFVYNILYKGWPIDYIIQPFTNGTLLLFAFFMITDPMTSPNHPRARVIWAVTIATISFVCSNFLYIFGAPFYVLFALAIFTPVLDKYWPGQKYNWQSKSK